MGILQVLVLTVAAVLPVVLADIIVQPGYVHGDDFQQTIPAGNYRQAAYYSPYQYLPYQAFTYGLNDGSGFQSQYGVYPAPSIRHIVPLHLSGKPMQYTRVGSTTMMHASPFTRHPLAVFAVQSRARRSTEDRPNTENADDVPTNPPVNDSPVRLVVDPSDKPGSTEDKLDEKTLKVRQSKHDDAIVGSPFLGLNPRNMYAGSHAYMPGIYGTPAEQPIMLRVIHPEARTSSADQPEDYQAPTGEGSLMNQQAETYDEPSKHEDEAQGGTVPQVDPEETLRQMVQKIELSRQQMAGYEANMNEGYDSENGKVFKSIADQQAPTTVLQQMMQQMGRIGTQQMMPENMMNQMAGPYSEPTYNTLPQTLENSEYTPYYGNDLHQEPVVAMASPSFSPVAQNGDMAWYNDDSMQNSVQNTIVRKAPSDDAPRTADASKTANFAGTSGPSEYKPMLGSFPDPRPIASTDEFDHETSPQDAKENQDQEKFEVHEKTDESTNRMAESDGSVTVGTFRTHHKDKKPTTTIQPIYIPYPAAPSNPNPAPSPAPTYTYPPASYIPAPPSYVYPAPSYTYPMPTYVYPAPSYTYPYVVRRYLLYPSNYYARNNPTNARTSTSDPYVSTHHMHHVKHLPLHRPHVPHVPHITHVPHAHHRKPIIHYRMAGLSDFLANINTGYPTYFQGN